jgi:hypothetical protein
VNVIEMNPGFTSANAAVLYALAGNAKLTVVSKATGARFTFRIRVAKGSEGARYFVSVLTGANNEADYTYLGTVFATGGCAYAHGRKSTIAPTATSAKAFAWVWKRLAAGYLPEGIEIHHEGSCGKCGRALTVPESIASGLGPVCAGAA